ncbi:2'-5' RNA ligase family protein [Inquilinus limosus]|uniref:2'-5' RNA ligase family protein n=1 Tax=Inquilinus limosus TaxID=171674 RepID=UPI003F17A006
MASNGSSRTSRGDPRQLSLDFGPPQTPSMSPDRIFFAILPSPADAAMIRAQAEALRLDLGLRGRLQPPEVLHISLQSVGEYQSLPFALVDRAMRAAWTIELPRFEVTFDRVTSFGAGSGARPVVLRCQEGNAALSDLYEAFDPAMEAVGLYRRHTRPRFSPHMTILYDRRIVPQTRLDAPITIPVRDFALVHSLYGESRHLILGRWPLRG